MRLYLESTIPSYVTARPARDIIQAARQQITRDWWNSQRTAHELFTSQITLDEIAPGDEEMARRRLEIMANVPLLELTAGAESLAETILSRGILPAIADSDAAHIAVATVHRMDILLTWNCRHIANAEIQVRLKRLIQEQGHELPVISTPEELPGTDYE